MDTPNLKLDGRTLLARQGFGLFQNTYSGGRTGASVAHYGGLTQVAYWGEMPEESPVTFFQGNPSSAYQRCFRMQILVDGLPYHPEFTQTEHYPFGYRSRFSLKELQVKVMHRLTLVNDAFLFSIEVMANPRQLPLQLRLEYHGFSRTEAPGRRFGEWEDETSPDAWTLSVVDEVHPDRWEKLCRLRDAQQRAFELQTDGFANYPLLHLGQKCGQTFIALAANSKLTRKTYHSGRETFTGEPFVSGMASAALVFAPNRETVIRRVDELRVTAADTIHHRESGHSRSLAKAPSLKTGNTDFDSLFLNIPSIEASLMVEDFPGALRASSTRYWVWGWDTLMCADAYLLAEQENFVAQTLRMFRDTAHPEQGVIHQMTRDRNARLCMAPSAQLLYAIVLHQYAVFTGDRTLWREFFPFVKLILERNLKTVNERGLAVGPALFPDYPQLAGHNGHDISVFNNSLLYQGMRCVEIMANDLGESEAAGQAGALARKLERHFLTAFWDSEAGYLVDSIDSRTSEQRRAHPAHATLWQTPFLCDLLGQRLATCGDFLAKHHATPRGYLMYPRDDIAFNADGNQFGQVWPTHDVFVTRSLAAGGKTTELLAWMRGPAWFWRQLTLIEGYSAQTVNDSGTPDLPGGKQAFGGRSIFMAAVTSLGGFSFDMGGITIGNGLAIRGKNLLFRQSRLSFESSGQGPFLSGLEVNGKEVPGSCKIPPELLRARTHLKIRRTQRPPDRPLLLSCHGAEVHSSDYVGDDLCLRIAARVPFWLEYWSPRKASLHWMGQHVSGDWHNGYGKVLLECQAGQPATLEINI